MTLKRENEDLIQDFNDPSALIGNIHLEDNFLNENLGVQPGGGLKMNIQTHGINLEDNDADAAFLEAERQRLEEEAFLAEA